MTSYIMELRGIVVENSVGRQRGKLRDEAMNVDILHEEKIIGHADLGPIDPSMGVAGGHFVPTPDYDPRLHAFVIDGEYNDLEGKAQLSACSAEFGVLRCEGVAIEDFNETVQEINIIILGMAYPEYETAFAS